MAGSPRNTLFHECKLLIRKELIECRWRVQFAGSVARKKVVTSKHAMSTNFSTDVVEDCAELSN